VQKIITKTCNLLLINWRLLINSKLCFIVNSFKEIIVYSGSLSLQLLGHSCSWSSSRCRFGCREVKRLGTQSLSVRSTQLPPNRLFRHRTCLPAFMFWSYTLTIPLPAKPGKTFAEGSPPVSCGDFLGLFQEGEHLLGLTQSSYQVNLLVSNKSLHHQPQLHVFSQFEHYLRRLQLCHESTSQ
jgi:hypothetical protein